MSPAELSTILPALGFISLDIHFPRPPGDPFNPQTWPFPIIHERAESSSEAEVVTGSRYSDAFIERFVDAGLRLAERGCVGIITSCGFLVMAQNELSARLPIPIATSSLAQLPSLLAIMPPRKTIGVLTYDSTRLNQLHLEQLGVVDAARVPIRGAPADGHLRRMIRREGPYVHAVIEEELVALAVGMVAEFEGREDGPEIGALLLECTQMPPFAEAIHAATGLPVYDVYTMGMWFYSGLTPRTPARWAGPTP